jgi:hypothetical protein
MRIVGISGMSPQEIDFELHQGGRFVVFQYCVSILIMTFKRPSPIYLIKAGQGTGVRSLPFILISLVLGWWGIPWGPIWTISSLIVNLRGGMDVTHQVAAAIWQVPAAPT